MPLMPFVTDFLKNLSESVATLLARRSHGKTLLPPLPHGGVVEVEK
jgi:hypothetical protein